MRRLHNSGGIDVGSLPAAFLHITKIFYVALRPLYRRIVQTENGQTNCRHKIKDALNDRKVYALVTDNTLFADLVLPCFELGLYEAHKLSLVLQNGAYRRKNELERDKRKIRNGKVERFRYLLGAYMTNVRALHIDDTFILPKRPCELTVAHIYGKDLLSTVFE